MFTHELGSQVLLQLKSLGECFTFVTLVNIPPGHLGIRNARSLVLQSIQTDCHSPL